MIGNLSVALFLVASVLAVGTSTSAPKPKCSNDPKHQGQQFLAHESDCEKYYECSNGIPYAFACQGGLHFDLPKKVCALPIIAGCATAIDGSEILDPAAGLVDLPDNLLDPLEQAVRKEDFEGSGYLKWPANAREDEAEGSGGLGPLDERCPAVDLIKKSVYLPHETDCGKFYQCSNGVAVLQSCPDGLHFNPDKNVCDYPANAGCANANWGGEAAGEIGVDNSEGSGDDVNETTTQRPDGDQCPAVDTNTTVYFPHETNCGRFYQCSNGDRILMRCPSGLHFNPTLNICDYPHNAGCANGGKPNKEREKHSHAKEEGRNETGERKSAVEKIAENDHK